MLVACNQPLYPFYIWWMAGGDWWISCWTFLSTPFFASVPLVARRNALVGRVMLPLVGIANGIVSTKAFGTASGVELFLLPCAFIALFGFRRAEWRTTAFLITIVILAAALHGLYGSALGRFNFVQYDHLWRLNAYSVSALSVAVVWMLLPARTVPAQR